MSLLLRQINFDWVSVSENKNGGTVASSKASDRKLISYVSDVRSMLTGFNLCQVKVPEWNQFYAIHHHSSRIQMWDVVRASQFYRLTNENTFSNAFTAVHGHRPVSESESERQRARNGTSESERDFSRERATIHTSESKRVKFKTARDFSFYSAVPWGSDCSDVCSI